jgi:UDP-N-acetyl-D-glucosamine dehydrogenase
LTLLEDRGGAVDYFDPFVSEIPPTRNYPSLAGRRSVPFDQTAISGYDAVLIATDHDAVDNQALVASAKLVIDTRNLCARSGIQSEKIVPA